MIPRRILRAVALVSVSALVGISATAARAADGDAGPATSENAPEVVERAPMTPVAPVAAAVPEAAVPAASGRPAPLTNAIARLEHEIAALTGGIDALLAQNRVIRYDATLDAWNVALLRDAQRHRIATARQRVLVDEQITQNFDKDARAALAEARALVADRDSDLAVLDRDRRRAEDSVNTLEWLVSARAAKQAALVQARADAAAYAQARAKRLPFDPAAP